MDHFDDPFTARRVHVRKAPEPAPHGMVYTHGHIGSEVTMGDHEALRAAIQERIRVKTGKDQLANAPDLKWLAVGLDGGHSAWQLNDHFGPRINPPYPFEYVDGLTLGCFDGLRLTRFGGRSRDIVRLDLGETSPSPMSSQPSGMA